MSTEPSLAEITVSLADEADLVVAQRQAVAEDKAAVEGLKAEVETIQQDVTAKQQQVAANLLATEGHKDTAAALDQSATDTLADITARQTDVIARQNDVITRQNDVTAKQADITTKQADVAALAGQVTADRQQVDAVKNQFGTTAALAETGVTDEGNRQASRVTEEGNTQTHRITAEGNTQVARATAEGNTQTVRVTDEGNRQTSRVTVEGNSQTHRVSTEGTTQALRVESAGDAGATTLQALVDEGQAAQDAVETIAAGFGSLEALNTQVSNQLLQAKSEAERATIKANEVSDNAAKVLADKNEAKQAKEDAVAIVHNDEGSVTAAPGKYPVADSNGHLDINWTPLLAAMYPNSGVLGSVNKSDLLTFKADTSADANKFTVNARQFNIHGRFVDLPQTVVTLAEAESTADRAIAFDDIFLDWDGNIVTHRSITPHRTTTGYDRDGIATEHGYTKVSTGLYKTGDTYLLLLGRVARRNKGAYHPVWNPEGSGGYRLISNPANVRQWFEGGLLPITSSEFCFQLKNNEPGASSWGNSISHSHNYRSDKKPHDAIYADDFTPLYYSAKNVVDRQALLFDSFNRAVAGETFSGAEGENTVPSMRCVNEAESANDNISIWFSGSNEPLSIPKYLPNLVGSPNNTKIISQYPNFHCSVKETGEDFSHSAYVYGNACFLALNRPDLKGKALTVSGIAISSDSARPQFLMVDIIGDLSAMPQEWIDNGIPGNWLAEGEEGESLIPDGTSKNFKLSRKCLECYQVLKTSDNGATWSDVTNTYKATIKDAGNSMGSQSFGATNVFMVFYRTSANPFELADKATALSHSSFVLSQADYRYNHGSVLTSNMVGKVPVLNGVLGYEYLAVQSFNMNSNGLLVSGSNREPVYLPPQVGATPVNIVCLPSLDEINGLYKMYIAYKERKHNGTSWGDDNKFNIVDYQSTVTNLNGETVIVGKKRVELPYIFY